MTNKIYIYISSGTKAEWLAAINNPANWSFGSATALPTGNIKVSDGVASQPDLTINLAGSPDPVIVGNPLTYTLTVNNSGSKQTKRQIWQTILGLYLFNADSSDV